MFHSLILLSPYQQSTLFIKWGGGREQNLVHIANGLNESQLFDNSLLIKLMNFILSDSFSPLSDDSLFVQNIFGDNNRCIRDVCRNASTLHFIVLLLSFDITLVVLIIIIIKMTLMFAYYIMAMYSTSASWRLRG